MEDHVTAKFALGELQLKDIIPLLREHLMIVMDPYDNWEVPSWEHRTEYNSICDGETVTEQDPDAPLILHFEHRPDSQFHTDQKIKIKDNEIIARDESHQEFKILLVKPADIVRMLLQGETT